MRDNKKSGFRNIALASFSPLALRNAKEKLPDFRTGIIYSSGVENTLRLALGIKADILLPKFELASRELVEKAHGHGLMVFTWTLNRKEEIRRAIVMEVDGFASDDPCFAREVLQGEI